MANELVLHRKDLIDNPAPRVPIVLCLDTSSSMRGDPIEELSKGVALFYASVFDDEIARYSAEISIVTFGGTIRKVAEFGPVQRQPELVFAARGHTPMAEGVCKALDILEDRKREYQENGIDYYQPWLVLMTDGTPTDMKGRPTDDVAEAVNRVVEMVNRRKLSVFPIGIGSRTNMGILGRFSPARSPLRLRGLEFGKFFSWLSASVQRVSASTPGQDIPLDEKGIKGWSTL